MFPNLEILNLPFNAQMNLRHLIFGCFGITGLMIVCALAGLFLDARPDVVGWIGQGMVVVAALILVGILVCAILLGFCFRQSLRNHSRPLEPYSRPPVVRSGPGRPRILARPALPVEQVDRIRREMNGQ